MGILGPLLHTLTASGRPVCERNLDVDEIAFLSLHAFGNTVILSVAVFILLVRTTLHFALPGYRPIILFVIGSFEAAVVRDRMSCCPSREPPNSKYTKRFAALTEVVDRDHADHLR